ncbi:MAG: transporter substrate-binding protein [Fuerstiella sp.]|nr:transporter substrate-binding protein [Fuerstiella sp.]
MLLARRSSFVITLGFLLFSSGCGGNGGDSSPSATTPQEPAATESSTAAQPDGSDSAVAAARVTDDPIEAAYFGVYVWKAAVEKAGSFDIDKVREAAYGLEFDAPGGRKRMHDSNHHTYKPVYIGEILRDGQFKIVKEFNDGGLVEPDAYSSYLHPDGDVPSPTGGPVAGAEYPQPDVTDDSVKVGILHSLSGTMAISETSLKDVVSFAVDEINKSGGVLGRQIDLVIEDPASDWDLFAEKARKMITEDGVAVIFGCWTSVSRKSVLPVFEEYNHLLFYPVQYEGEELSLNVFYTAAPPNQQLVPAAQYMLDDGVKKFYLLGTDYVFPRTANKVLKAFLLAQGVPETNIIEEYTPFHHQDYQTIVQKVKDFAASGDACVLSTINGDSNVPFYKEFANQGLTSADCPIMAFSVAEDELRAMDVPPLVGHLACWNYFQSIASAENAAFVEGFQAYCQANGLK